MQPPPYGGPQYPPQQPYPQQGYGGPQFSPQYPQQGGPPKKSKTGLIIGLVALVLVPVLGGVGCLGIRAKKSSQCNASYSFSDCNSEGKCSINALGTRCVAADDDDCHKGEVCKKSGRCVAKNNSCVAATAADCRASTNCREKGLCDLRPGQDYCQATKVEDCKASTDCKTYSKCELSSYYSCHDPNEYKNSSSSSGYSSSSGGSSSGSYGGSSGGGSVTYTCRPGCTYAGNGMCRCRR